MAEIPSSGQVLTSIDFTSEKGMSIIDKDTFVDKKNIELILDNSIVLSDAQQFFENLISESSVVSSVSIRAANTSEEHPNNNNLKGLKLIVDWIIRMNSNITRLSLEGNGSQSTSEDWLNIFLDLLRYAKASITYLRIDLSGSPVSNEMLKNISEQCTEMGQVSSLDLRLGRNITCKGKHIGRFFKSIYTRSGMRNLRELTIDVRGIHLGHANSRDVIEIAILNAGSLREVQMILAGCSIQKKGMEALKKQISQMKLAEKIRIDVSENALVDDFFKDFFRAFWILPAETPLTHLELNLAENYFAAQTTESLQEGFKTFAALKNLQSLELVLRKNSITDQLASQIIQCNTYLNKLNAFIVDLSNSREKLEGRLQLDDHLRTSAESLAHFSVNIQGNPVSDESIKLLIDSIESITPPLSIENITILVDNVSAITTTSIKLPNLHISNKLSLV